MVSYEPLNKTLKERSMKRTDLLPYMSSATPTKLANNKVISIKTIDTICRVLHCRIEDVAVYVEEKEDGYFACSVGNVSEQMLKEYIENQG